jgi:hydrogenase maturation protease
MPFSPVENRTRLMSAKKSKSPILIVGVGNRYRRDDAVGLYVVRKIRQRNIPGIDIIDHCNDAAALIERWSGCELAIIVDCIYDENKSAGEIRRFHPLKESLTALPGRLLSSHSLDLIGAIEIARNLGRLPVDLMVYGIVGRDFDHGEKMTASVMEAADSLVEEIARRVSTD